MKFPRTNAEGQCLCVACCDERGKVATTMRGLEAVQDYLNKNFRYGCDVCGNKRCPHHRDHRFKCTGSNQPGQKGVLDV